MPAKKPAKSQKPTGKRLGARSELTNPTLADRRSVPRRKNETVQQEVQRLNRGMSGTGRTWRGADNGGYLDTYGESSRRDRGGLSKYKPAAKKTAAAKKSATIKKRSR
jgi:uncharacterized protein YukE